MPTIPLNQIVVEDRQREDLGDIAELAKSIAEFGQLQPIVVERRADAFYLRAGGRRLTAVAYLQRTEIEAVVLGEMSELQAQLVELEENIRRKQLEWQEEVKAVEKIHALKMKDDKLWTAEKTAAIIGKSRRTVFNALELSKAVETIPDVAAADKPLAAMNRLKRHKQMEQRKIDVSLRRVQAARDDTPGALLAWHVHNGDCVPYLKELADGCMDMVLTDPPWAVNYDDLLIGEQKSFDDSDRVLPTVRDAMRETFRVLRDQRFCIMYWPSNATAVKPDVLQSLGAPVGLTLHELGRWFLSSAGYRVWPRPLIWYKANKNFGSMNDPSKQVNSQYETMFLAFKGDARFFKRLAGDVLEGDSPGAERVHPNEKNLEVSETLIDACTVHGENVLDPFCGGGVHGEAALLMERNCHMCELDNEFADRASVRCESISQKKVAGEIPPLALEPDEEQNSTEDGPLAAVVVPNPNRAIVAPSEPLSDDELFEQ